MTKDKNFLLVKRSGDDPAGEGKISAVQLMKAHEWSSR